MKNFNKNKEKGIVENQWLRSKHVREMLHISDSTLQTLRINGCIPAYRLGASWFYRKNEILEALKAGKIKRKEVKIDEN